MVLLVKKYTLCKQIFKKIDFIPSGQDIICERILFCKRIALVKATDFFP